MKATPSFAVASDVVVTVSGGWLMVMTNACVAVAAAAFVTVALKLNVPAVVGTPLIAPDVASVRPGGSTPLVSAHVNGGLSPVAVNAV